jgi:hypothetical protein
MGMPLRFYRAITQDSCCSNVIGEPGPAAQVRLIFNRGIRASCSASATVAKDRRGADCGLQPLGVSLFLERF